MHPYYKKTPKKNTGPGPLNILDVLNEK